MKRMKKTLIYSGACALAGMIALIISRGADWFGEWYATHIFPAFPVTVGRIVSLLPFSLFEILIYAAAALAAAYIIYLLFLIILPRERVYVMRAIAKALGVLLAAACSVFLIFMLTCGVNYQRDTFADITDRQINKSSKADLSALCSILINEVAAALDEIADDESQALPMEDSAAIKREARDSMKRLGQEVKELDGYYPSPKPVLSSEFMSKLGLTGMYSPFTVEANYNKDIPEYLIPYTMCHELAHMKGFMREDEAGFIAYLACRGSSDAGFRYSGAMNALSYALAAYRRESKTDEYSLLIEALPEQAVRDFVANNAYWSRFKGPVSATASKANDAYLKANSQREGVKSYGGMVDLLLSEHWDDIKNAL